MCSLMLNDNILIGKNLMNRQPFIKFVMLFHCQTLHCTVVISWPIILSCVIKSVQVKNAVLYLSRNFEHGTYIYGYTEALQIAHM